MAHSKPESKYTTMSIQESTRDRLRELKPYKSLTYSEFLDEMADFWVQNRGDRRD